MYQKARIQRGYLERKDEDEPLNRLFNTSPVFFKYQGLIQYKIVI